VKLNRPLSSPQVQNAWSSTTTPTYVFIQHRCNLTSCLCLISMGIARGRCPRATFQTRTVLLVLLSPDIGTGTADITSGVAGSDVRVSGTRCIVFACSGLEPTQMCASFYILAVRKASPLPFLATKSGKALVQCPVK
jgi:hypothetical protein